MFANISSNHRSPVLTARLTKSCHGLDAGDTLLADPVLEPDFALVRLIPSSFLTLLQLDQEHAIEYLSDPLYPEEVTRLLEAHFLTLRRRHRQHLGLLP